MSNLPFVWELDYNGGVQSHLVGTTHLLPQWTNVPNFEPAADRLLCEKRNMLIELDLAKADFRQIAQALCAERIGDYWDILNEEERILLGKITEVDYAKLAKMPTVMISPALIKAAGITTTSGIEEICREPARKYMIPISSLETTEEQIQYLNEMREKTSVFLRRMIDREKRETGFMHEYTRRIFRNYLSGDENNILKDSWILSERPPSHLQRNQNMVQRSLSYLANPTVVAVGLAHCLGKDSMVDFYREQVITIRRV